MLVPEHLKYSREHVWVRVEGSRAVLGMTDFAQTEFGGIVFVELPEEGDVVNAGEPFCSVESVKSVTELASPLTGKVLRANRVLEREPMLVNQSPYEKGWMVELEWSDARELEPLWTAEQYAAAYDQEDGRQGRDE
jgi:glycine cleavage system H protein